MRNLLEEFNEDHGVRPPSILGVREHIFTGRLHEHSKFRYQFLHFEDVEPLDKLTFSNIYVGFFNMYLQCVFLGLVHVKPGNKLCYNWTESPRKAVEVCSSFSCLFLNLFHGTWATIQNSSIDDNSDHMHRVVCFSYASSTVLIHTHIKFLVLVS